MHFGSDFFKIVEFVVAILRLFARVFGDADDAKSDAETKAKFGDYAEKIL